MGHSSIERRLRTDIAARHSLKNKIRRKRSLVTKLTRNLERTKKKRLNNRYSVAIRRLEEEAENLELKLNEMNIELQKRIMAEMKFSEEEIQTYTEQYEKEYSEMSETKHKLKAIEEGTAEPGAEQSSEEESAPKEAIVARTKRMLNRERRVVEKIQREIDSEERDKVLFANELRQIMADLEAYGENQASIIRR